MRKKFVQIQNLVKKQQKKTFIIILIFCYKILNKFIEMYLKNVALYS